MNCQRTLETQLSKLHEIVRVTIQDDHEHAYAFNEYNSTEIVLGDCDNVPRPTMPEMIGTVHSHTLDYSRFSEGDIETFTKSTDKVMCYVVPKEGVWVAQCVD